MSQKNHVEEMARLVEGALGNPFSRIILGFCSKRCSCGDRVELALNEMSGLKQKMCLRCKISSKITRFILSTFAKNNHVKEEYVLAAIKDSYWRKGLSTVLAGIAEFGVRKPFVGRAPFLIVWNFTGACNLACKHCYEKAHYPRPDELTTRQALNAVESLSREGVAFIAMSGGEPLARQDFFQVAEKIKEMGMGMSIATNATLITPKVAKKLRESNCVYAQVSLDGAKAKTHDAFRGKKSFKRTIAGIRNLVKEGVGVGISCTVTKHNYNEVPAELDLVEKLGAGIFMHYNFIHVGRGREIKKMDITPAQREELLLYLLNQNGKRKITLLSTAPQFARVCSGFAYGSLTHFDIFGKNPQLAESSAFLADFVGGCGTGRLYLGMEPNGDLIPCVFIQRKIGNINDIDFHSVWTKNRDLIEIRNRKAFKGNCGVCEFNARCGGCRARSLGYYGDLTHSDPGCIKNQNEWDKLMGINK